MSAASDKRLADSGYRKCDRVNCGAHIDDSGRFGCWCKFEEGPFFLAGPVGVAPQTEEKHEKTQQ